MKADAARLRCGDKAARGGGTNCPACEGCAALVARTQTGYAMASIHISRLSSPQDTARQTRQSLVWPDTSASLCEVE